MALANWWICTNVNHVTNNTGPAKSGCGLGEDISIFGEHFCEDTLVGEVFQKWFAFVGLVSLGRWGWVRLPVFGRRL